MSDAQRTSPQYRDYLIDYPFGGARWGLTIKATSAEEAEARLKSLGAWGRVEGELHETIRVPAGVGWIGRLLVAARVRWLNRGKA